MKKSLIYRISILITLFTTLCVSNGCNEEITNPSEITKIEDIYFSFSNELKESLDTAFISMGMVTSQIPSSEINLNEIYDTLMNANTEHLDYINETFYDKYERFLLADQKIQNNIANIYHQNDPLLDSFVIEYLNNGYCEDFQYIEDYLNRNNRTLQNQIILAAVYVDIIVRPILSHSINLQTRGMTACEMQLAADIAASTAQSVRLAIELDGEDNPVVDIICGAGDVIDIINAMNKYKECKKAKG